MTDAPILFRWSGEAMEPLPRFHNFANATYVVGETYRLTVEEERSAVSHRHYFATIHDLWMNLPEDETRFPTPKHLRKHALVMTGYRDERTLVASSKAEALRLAAFIKPMDEYAVVSVREAVVQVWTAQSQSQKAMGKQAFQESKDRVLGFLYDMLGVDEPGRDRHRRAA